MDRTKSSGEEETVMTGCTGCCRARSPSTSHAKHFLAVAVVLLLGISNLHTCLAEHVPPTFKPANLKIFQDPDSKYYRYINLDRNNNKVYVGGMEYLYRLDATNIEQYERSVNLSTKSEDNWMIEVNRESCINRGKTPNFDCRNHVRAVIVYDDEIYVCGTGAYNPQDYYLKSSDLSMKSVGAQASGRAKCPYDPNDNATCVYVRSGNPGGFETAYSGTMADFAKLDPVIYRPTLGDEYNLLRTVPKDSKWLYEPNFVGSFDVGDFVYFFFRETAIEYSNCGRTIYSRVARVCKNDQGGSSVLGGKWTTYLKARLNCSIPGEFPYYFNEIHDVFRDETSDKFYGVFTTNVNGLPGSAVCAFSLQSIENAFQGDFKEQIDSSSTWSRVPNSKVPSPRPGRCDSESQSLPDNVLQFIKARPLMDQAISHDNGKPLYYQRDVIFQRLVVDFVDNYRVFYLGTNRGQVYKIVEWESESSSQRESKLLAIYNPFEDVSDDALPIWQMKLHNNRLYVASDEAVVEFSVAQCSLYSLCTDCVQDPHCGWDVQSRTCKLYQSGYRRYVDTVSPLASCDGQCAKTSSQRHFVKLQRDPVHLDCDSHCQVDLGVEWYFQNTPINIDNQKYFLTQENGLVVLNTTHTNTGWYYCKGKTLEGGPVTLSTHSVNVTRCDNAECHWREEFQNWCSAFDDYKSQLNHWTCLKNTCLDDDNCLPDMVSSQCKEHGP